MIINIYELVISINNLIEMEVIKKINQVKVPLLLTVIGTIIVQKCLGYRLINLDVFGRDGLLNRKWRVNA